MCQADRHPVATKLQTTHPALALKSNNLSFTSGLPDFGGERYMVIWRAFAHASMHGLAQISEPRLVGQV